MVKQLKLNIHTDEKIVNKKIKEEFIRVFNTPSACGGVIDSQECEYLWWL